MEISNLENTNSNLQSNNNQSYPVVQTSTKAKKIIFHLVATAFLLLFGMAAGYWLKPVQTQKNQDQLTDAKIGNKPVDYVIPGVSFGGFHNHKGLMAYADGDTSTAMAAIVEYWNPGKANFVEIDRKLETGGRLITGEKVIDYFNQLKDYNVQEERLTVNELKKFINPEVRTPLFLFFPVSKDQPSTIVYHPAAVVIGFKESERKIVMHNYWLGSNFEISFEDFEKSWSSMRSDEQNAYIIVQPKNLTEKLKELDSRKIESYPKRSSVTDKSVAMMVNLGLGIGADMSGLKEKSMDYYVKVLTDPNYSEYLPPIGKLLVNMYIARDYLDKGELDKALDHANKSVEINHDLDKSFIDWPGYDVRTARKDVADKSNRPYTTQGAVYKAKGEFELAKASYQKALDLNSTDEEALAGLRIVELELAKRPTKSEGQ